MDGKLYLVDTNAWIDNLDEIKQYKMVVSSSVLRELDKLKQSKNQELSYRARVATRYIKQNKDNFIFDLNDYNAETILGQDFENSYMDNRILACLKRNPHYVLITNDILLQLKAEALNLEVLAFEETHTFDDTEYKGFKEVHMTESEFREFHDERLDQNEFNLHLNQYLIIKDTDDENKEPRAFKYDGEFYISIKSKPLKSMQLGTFSPKDIYQQCAIDSLINNKFIMLRGKAGTAKTLLALSYAMQQMQTGKFDKLVVFSNSVPTHGAFYHGLVKGDIQQKLAQSSIGHILASKLGSYDEVEAMIITEKLLILPMSDIRGFDTSGMKAITLITEAQNTSRELMKLAIQRNGEDGKIIVEGDNDTQLDIISFSGANNGMTAASEVFRGQDYYGEIELQNIYRSEWAERAELMSLKQF